MERGGDVEHFIKECRVLESRLQHRVWVDEEALAKSISHHQKSLSKSHECRHIMAALFHFSVVFSKVDEVDKISVFNGRADHYRAAKEEVVAPLHEGGDLFEGRSIKFLSWCEMFRVFPRDGICVFDVTSDVDDFDVVHHHNRLD